jgi:hypothetical protein
MMIHMQSNTTNLVGTILHIITGRTKRVKVRAKELEGLGDSRHRGGRRCNLRSKGNEGSMDNAILRILDAGDEKLQILLFGQILLSLPRKVQISKIVSEITLEKPNMVGFTSKRSRI